MEWLILGATVGLGFYLAWTIGANDFADSMSDRVGVGALTVRKRLFMGHVANWQVRF